MLLRSFSTDERFLRRGYAKKVFVHLPRVVGELFPLCDEIVLAVNVQNEAAKKLYMVAGFQDFGVRLQGRNGELIVLSLKL